MTGRGSTSVITSITNFFKRRMVEKKLNKFVKERIPVTDEDKQAWKKLPREHLIFATKKLFEAHPMDMLQGTFSFLNEIFKLHRITSEDFKAQIENGGLRLNLKHKSFPKLYDN